jgi:MoaA/NifB/PqqE/SkfB family radical SAM enzyme
MCPQFNSAQEQNNKDLTIEQYQLILNKFPYLIRLNLIGAGEPFLNQDFCEMIKIAKERRIKVNFVTNGLLLTKEIARKIVDYRVDSVVFSIDGATKKTYENIRQGSNFETVLNNVRYLVELKNGNALNRERNLPDLGVNFVTMKENLDELPQIVDLVSSLGIKKLFVNRVRMMQGCRNRMGNIDLTDAQGLRQILSQTLEKAGDLEMNLPLASFYPTYTRRKCKVAWFGPIVSCDGVVTPCCVAELNMGNIYQQDFLEIWNGSAYQDFRRALKTSDPLSIASYCRECLYYNCLLPGRQE